MNDNNGSTDPITPVISEKGITHGDVALVMRGDGEIVIHAPGAVRGGLVDVDKMPDPGRFMFMLALWKLAHEEDLMDAALSDVEQNITAFSEAMKKGRH